MLITDKPEDLPTGNDLDDIDALDAADDVDAIPRYLGFGTTPKAIENPPQVGEVVVYQVKVEGIGDGRRKRADGEMRYRTDLAILAVARVGDELPPDYVADLTPAQIARARKDAEKAEADAAAAQAQREADENQPELFGDEVQGDNTAGPPIDDEEAGRPAFSDGGAK